jgi:hypothetical protein
VDLGGPEPTAILGVGESGHHAFVCAATTDTDGSGALEVTLHPRGDLLGDALGLWLLDASHPPWPFDALLALAPSARFAVVRTGQRTLLKDAVLETETDLTALGAAAEDPSFPASVTFDGASRRMTYLSVKDGRAQLVVRELESGKEARLPPLDAAALARVQLDPVGDWVFVESGTAPAKPITPPAVCPRPVARFTAPRAGRSPALQAITVGSTAWQAVRGLLAPLGRGLVRRAADGSLVVEEPGGAPIELAPARCEAKLVHWDGVRERLLVTCKRERGRPQLALVGPGVFLPLEAEFAARDDAPWRAEVKRLIPVYPGQDALLVDLDRQRAAPLAPRDLVLATADGNALVLRGERLVVHDADSGTERVLEVEGVRTPEVHVRGSLVVASPWLVDLGRGSVLGSFQGRPLALLASGEVAVARGRDADAGRLAQGPLTWVRATPAD